MMNVFLDTNILIDYLSRRNPFFESSPCCSSLVRGRNAICLSPHYLLPQRVSSCRHITKCHLRGSGNCSTRSFASAPLQPSTREQSPRPSSPSWKTLKMPCNTPQHYTHPQMSSSPATPKISSTQISHLHTHRILGTLLQVRYSS